MKKSYLWIFLFAFSLLSAEDHFDDEPDAQEVAPPSLVNLTSLPSSIVNNSVNIISGDLITSSQDLAISGPDPYILGHSFSSAHVEEKGTLAHGWNFSHYNLLRVFQPYEINFASANRHDHHLSKNEGDHCIHGEPENFDENPFTYIFLTEPSGHKLLFKGNGWARHFKLVKKNSGYTNVCGGELSGRTNIKNITIDWHCETDRWHAHFPDGTKRVYGRRKAIQKPEEFRDNWRDYHLVWEVLPSGNFRVFHYHDNAKISSIRTYNHDSSRLLNWIKFSHKKRSLTVSTSDKQNVHYFFKKAPHGRKTLSSIKRTGLAATNFSHCKKDGTHRLMSIWSDTGFYAESRYYHHSSNMMGNSNFKFRDSKQKRRSHGKVREQKSPVGPAGSKWSTHRYFYHKDAATVRDAYGAITRYYWDDNKRLTKIARFDSSDKALMNETFSWHQGHLTSHTLRDENDWLRLSKEYAYDSRGNVIKETIYEGVSGHAIKKRTIHREFSDDGFNLLLSEEDPEGNFTYYEYYPRKNLLKAKFTCDKKEIKKREFFSYDKNACLTKHVIDDGSSRNEDSLHKVTERHTTKITPRKKRPHFGEPRIIKEFALRNGKNVLLSKIVNTFSKKGFIIKKAFYDAKGALYSTTHYTHDDLGRITSTTDSLGRTILLSYDRAGRISRKETPTLITTYSYDKMGNLTTQTEQEKNGTTLINRYTYDLLGRKSAHINPQGHATYFSYDALNRITKITYPQGAEKHYSYEKLGAIVTEKNEKKHITKTTFDALGLMVSKKLPDDTEIKRSYDSRGNCTEEIATNGTVTYKDYDFLNRLTSSTTEGAKTSYTYNAFHLLSETTPTNEKLSFTYDFAGRKASESQGDRKTAYTYDSIGRLQTETTGDIAKRFTYDIAHRLVEEEHTCKNSRLKKRYAYDVDDNLIEETTGLSTTTARYDAFKRPIEKTDAQGNTWHILYNDYFVNDWNDKVLKKRIVHPTGVFEEELYDIRGLLSSVKRFDPLGNVISDKEYNYDVSGNCTRVFEQCFGGSKESITTLYSYGALNRLEWMEEGANNPEARKTTFFYNKYGQKERVSDPEGHSIHYLYDTKGRLSQFHGYRFNYSYEYDASDRLIGVKNNDTNQSTTRTYTSFGDLASETLETGLTTHYEYDSLGRLSRLTLPDSSTVEYQHGLFLESVSRGDWSYNVLERDYAGNILSSKLPKEAGEIHFSYDSLNHKTKIAHPAYEQELLKFDPVGNLLEMKVNGEVSTYSYTYLYQLQEEKSHTHQNYSYNAVHDRLSHTTDALHCILHDGNRSFTYDRRGNRSSMDDVQYVYDGLDRLVEVKTPTETISYAYDAFNRRIEKKSGNCHERYLYIDQNEIGAVDSTGKITQLRILGEGLGAEIGASIAFEFESKLYIPIHDHRGNVATLLDEEGRVVESYRYDAYGVEETSSNLNPWRFSSKRVDPETGLVYFGRRYYDPSLGSWLTSDPLGPDAGPNLYAYALCNPMMKFDLYGLIDEDAGGSDTTANQVNVYVFDQPLPYFEHEGKVLTPLNKDYMKFYDDYYYERCGEFQYAEHEVSANRDVAEQRSGWERAWDVTRDAAFLGAESVLLAFDMQSVYLMAIPTLPTMAAGLGLKASARAGLKLLRSLIVRTGKTIPKDSKTTLCFLRKAVGSPKASYWLPKNPEELLHYGYKEITHPKALKCGHRTFRNPQTGDMFRFDSAKPGKTGHAGKNHYHRHNPNSRGDSDYYLDKHGNPCREGSPESHLYPE